MQSLLFYRLWAGCCCSIAVVMNGSSVTVVTVVTVVKVVAVVPEVTEVAGVTVALILTVF